MYVCMYVYMHASMHEVDSKPILQTKMNAILLSLKKQDKLS